MPATVAQSTECSSPNIELSTQAEVDAFQADFSNGGTCSVVTGRLRIRGSDITDLGGLSVLTSVGNLEVNNSDALADLDGLSGLTSVRNLEVSNNDSIANLDGLNGLTSVPENLVVSNIGALTNLDGLSGITSVGGNLSVFGNDALTNLDGLSGITSVGGNLSVYSNPALANLDGLSRITNVGGALQIATSAALTNFAGLSGITSVGGSLRVNANPALTDLGGLSGITSVGGDLVVSDNDALTNLDGLSGITSVGSSLSVLFNDALADLDGLSNITDVGEDLFVTNNRALTNLDGLSRITGVEGSLFVVNNDALPNLNGLSGIISVGLRLEVRENSALTSCAALAPVLGWPPPYDSGNDFVGGGVRFRNNAAGAQSPDDCLDAFVPNPNVALFDDRQAFLEITDVQQASDAYAVENLPDEPFVSGNVAFSSGTESSLNFGVWPADFEGDNDIELAINGAEDLDIRSEAGPVFALGVDFNDESGGASPSTFTVTGLRNGGELFSFEFTTPPAENRNFIGVRSNLFFDTLRIREVQTANENEYFGTVYISSTEVGDNDGDGLFDDRDRCNVTPSNEVGEIDNDGCGPSERDTDGDGVNDSQDAFPLDATEQSDSDGDGFGDNQEIDAGSDPNDAGDVPGATGLPAWLLYEASH
ncbi:MAG: hypothetical protein AAFY29_02030 [Pseudomonadota bacterium]